jgi:hypothetical protein
MEAEGQGHVPTKMVEELEEAIGSQLPSGYQEGLQGMYHLWEELPCSYR